MQGRSLGIAIALLVLAGTAWLSGPGDWQEAAPLVAAGLFGAGLSQLVAWHGASVEQRERDRAADSARTSEALRDLDESRRLVQMVRLSLRDGRPSPEVAATLWNALAHHSDVVSPDEASQFVQTALSYRGPDKEPLLRTADDLIARITAREHSIRHEAGGS